MNSEFNIPTDMIDLVTMQEDRSLRVDMKLDRGAKEVHFAPTHYVYQPGDPVHEKLLELTGIRKPGDNYSFSLRVREGEGGTID